jgi:deoxyribonuclease V
MKLNPSAIRHNWDLNPQQAMALQSQLSGRIIRKPTINIEEVVTVAGVDTHYQDGLALAAAVVIKLPDLETVEYATAVKKIRFPYIPGLLTFREGPAILEALNKLVSTPDLLMFDGQGIAHPRRCGLASHIGLLLDRPSIGCAKTLLSGHYQEPGTGKGSYSHLKDRDETIGAVVRTRSGVRPLFVSIGHRINLQDSIHVVLKCCHRYRLPETMRRADQLAREELKHIAPIKK